MRLIDADALKEAWCERCDNRHLCGDKAGCDEVKELYAMPTIEAEPITTEKAVEYLMRTKWFQEHDTAMIEKGMEKQKKLNAIDLQELEDRFGKFVRFVVEDMISGEGKRWKDDN